jgi:hypothetical protein
MDEAARKRKLVAEVNALRGGYARRYEDRWAIGLLDLFFKIPRLPPIWAEAKIIKGNVFAPTERQHIEGERMIAAGLTVLLIGWRDRIIYVSPWTPQADRRTCVSGIDQLGALREYMNEPR